MSDCNKCPGCNEPTDEEKDDKKDNKDDKNEYSDEEEAAVKERLKGLGYLD